MSPLGRKEKSMRITSIQITNLAAFGGEVKFSFGAVNIVEGKHGAGKSSLEGVLMYLLGRRPLAAKGARSVQHDPGILHGTSDRGEAIVNFDECDIEYLRVLVKPDKSTREVKMRGSKRWEDAGQLIDDITSALAYDPMQFKDLEPKQRLEAFLRVVPVEITAAEVTEAVGGTIPIPAGKPGLDTINALHDDIYRLRTTENSAVDTQSKYATQLEAALPPVVEGGDWNSEVIRLRGEKEILQKSEDEEIKRIGGELQTVRNAVAVARQSADTEIDSDINTRISALEADRSRRKDECAKEAEVAIEAGRSKANAEAKEIREANAPLHSQLAADIAVADERARSTAQAEGTSNAAKVARDEAEERKAKSKSMTEALDRLTTLKATVGSRMKVSGVTIASPREGSPVDLCRLEAGALVPFSRWNSADQDQFCLRMAVLFSGPLGIVCIDNLSNWNAERRAAIIARCKVLASKDRMQFLLGMATDGELKVTEA